VDAISAALVGRCRGRAGSPVSAARAESNGRPGASNFSRRTTLAGADVEPVDQPGSRSGLVQVEDLAALDFAAASTAVDAGVEETSRGTAGRGELDGKAEGTGISALRGQDGGKIPLGFEARGARDRRGGVRRIRRPPFTV
jgi:hypothetical protein